MAISYVKNQGFTESERVLHKFAEKSFLDLWSWPNVYRKKNKELCDLLVVCGKHVIVFSDKTISYPTSDDLKHNWNKWYRKAVLASTEQAKGAVRWIKEYPDRVYVDKDCTQKFPFDLSRNDYQFHIVCVALGAEKACSDFFNGDSGSLMIRVEKDDGEMMPMPFTVGDINEGGAFIHVVNETNLNIILNELDTITDFTDYLSEKESFLRSGIDVLAAGEEELLAWYLQGMKNEFKHGFVLPKDDSGKDSTAVWFDVGIYDEFINSDEYKAKKNADKISKMWDVLIQTFTQYMLDGTTIVPEDDVFSIDSHRAGVETMALESRVMRRLFSEGLHGMLMKSHLQTRTFRATIPPFQAVEGVNVGYVFMTLANPSKKKISYERYRKTRQNMLTTYVLGMLRKCPHIDKIVGIAFEPPTERGSSEDMIYAEQPEWTPELIKNLETDRETFNILQDDNVTFMNFGVSEYPDTANTNKN